MTADPHAMPPEHPLDGLRLAASGPGGAERTSERPSLSDREFRTVLRGWDPREVREHLDQLDELHGSGVAIEAEAQRRAEEVVAAARVEADQIVGAARREADALEVERHALMARLRGELSAAARSEAEADAEQIRDAARREADQIIAEAQRSAVPAEPASPTRWDEVGTYVARVLEQADTEARAIREAAEADARVLVADAETQRRSAVAEADAVLEAAVPRARDHIHEVLALAHEELDTTKAQLGRTVDQLRTVHETLAHSLADLADLPELATATELVQVDDVSASTSVAGGAATPDPAEGATATDNLGAAPAPLVDHGPDRAAHVAHDPAVPSDAARGALAPVPDVPEGRPIR